MKTTSNKAENNSDLEIEDQLTENSSLEQKSVRKKYSGMFSSSNISGYFRELSIVIIGVLITLLITNVISDYKRQKEIEGMLKFVKMELAENLENLEWIQWRWEGERHIFHLILENSDNLHEIPIDTLNEYSYAIGALYYSTTKRESYELLKSSLLIQYVKDKDVLLMLSNTYKFHGLEKQLSNYTEQKISFLNPVLIDMDENDLKNLNNGNNYNLFNYIVHKNEFRKFVFISESILSPPDIFEKCKKDIRETIQVLEKKGF